ncbi:TetR/AcrR family transcriptional regulator [Amycolatopsis suaedae]|uniref:TetR/AcrR family transcriptional regulator n=1 Tax=Amycolatopsis suaedae TaxID=2510978 RepID=A0A4Q7J738_9PSEU|nr:TetR/AcrR family transcriptional regulator [Amycolatopsis suaedae]RZQ63470.1 TetR/AcrR family transcriptional regulator [Amycolatopsis suaedae]
MAGRRGDTRERIREVALKLFIRQGYEKTTLREIAEELEVTKAALYYHFPTKEAIVRCLVQELVALIDELIAWVEAKPPGPQLHVEFLGRFSEVVSGDFGRLILFVQHNLPTMRDIVGAGAVGERLTTLFDLLYRGEDPEARLRIRLALIAVLFGNNATVLTDRRREPQPELALRVALDLASPRASAVSTGT